MGDISMRNYAAITNLFITCSVKNLTEVWLLFIVYNLSLSLFYLSQYIKLFFKIEYY